MFGRRPITQQLIMATFGALLLVFPPMIFIVQRQADQVALTVAEQNLGQEAKLMASMLDSAFDAVRVRAESDAQLFVRYSGGVPEVAAELVPTGGAKLPGVHIGGAWPMAISVFWRLFAR